MIPPTCPNWKNCTIHFQIAILKQKNNNWSYLLFKTKFCTSLTNKKFIEFSLPNYNHFQINCYLKATWNILLISINLLYIIWILLKTTLDFVSTSPYSERSQSRKQKIWKNQVIYFRVQNLFLIWCWKLNDLINYDEDKIWFFPQLINIDNKIQLQRLWYISICFHLWKTFMGIRIRCKNVSISLEELILYSFS